MNKELYWGGKSKKPTSINFAEGMINVDATIQTETNHVYFYKGVGTESVLELNRLLQQKSTELIKASMDIGNGKPVLYLHINSMGGSIFDGIAAMDTIIRLKKTVDIISVIDGACASAATFMSLVATKRVMHKHSYMLIHQLSGGHWGKYNELKDEMKNTDELMKTIRDIYKEYTNVPMEKLDKILEHDIWWDSDKCLKLGLIDEIWG